MLLNIHHIVSDGWSVKVLFDEVTTLYQARPLSPLPVQYIDYAFWQIERKIQGDFERHLTYWQKQLADAPQQLELATDYARPPVQDNTGQAITFELPPLLTERLKTLGAQHGATLFMTLMTGFNVLLMRYSQQTDVLIGTPMANRNQVELEGLIGFLVNTLVIRSHIDKNDTVATALNKVKQTTLQAYDYQEMPFEMLVHHLNPARSLSYNPIFQVMFTLQNTGMGEFELPGLHTRLRSTGNDTAKFDLTLEMTEVEGVLQGRLEYATALFDPSTITRMIGHYQRLLEGMVDATNLSVSQLPLLSDDEQHHLSHTLNDTQADFPQNIGIHEQFEQQAKRTPNATAVIFDQQPLSYRQLNEKANQLAHYLRAQGVEPYTLVGLSLERSVEMVVGILAILKAGGAYVPMDPGYPQDRLDYMLKDSNVKLLLNEKSFDRKLLQSFDTSNPVRGDNFTANNLAYVIYTSGSTGLPKGVMVEHQALVNRIDWMQKQYGLKADDVVLQKTPFSFDVSVWEFVWPLTTGATLVVAKPEGHKDPLYLTNLIRQCNVTTLHFVPSMLRLMLAEPQWSQCTSIRHL
ncbi:MAG: condensation domain-containing protein, partial [Psychrosphaera sp.]|nr:condensation domain-containing protein [Psychrosphaera sp.]